LALPTGSVASYNRDSIVADSEKTAAARARKSVRIFVAGILCLHAVLFIKLWGYIERGYPDFTVYYTAAKILRSGLGHQLYAGQVQTEVQKRFTGELPSRRGALPYIHPPFEALIFVPLAHFPYRQAFVLWDLANLAMLFGVCWLLRERLSRLISPWASVLGALAFFPVFACLLQGQDSILQLLLCALAWRALDKQADVLAGCWLGFASFKFQFTIPIVLLVVIWKRRRVLVGFIAVAGVLALISLVLVGWQGALRYPEFALRIADTPSLGGSPPDFVPNLRGLVMGCPLRVSGSLATVLANAGSLMLFIFAALKGRLLAGLQTSALQPQSTDLQVSFAILVSGLVAWNTNVHDWTLLVLSLTLSAAYCLRMPEQHAGRRFALLVPAVPILISPLWFVVWLVSGTVNLMAIPLLWWAWKLGQELSRHPSAIHAAASGESSWS